MIEIKCPCFRLNPRSEIFSRDSILKSAFLFSERPFECDAVKVEIVKEYPNVFNWNLYAVTKRGCT